MSREIRGERERERNWWVLMGCPKLNGEGVAKSGFALFSQKLGLCLTLLSIAPKDQMLQCSSTARFIYRADEQRFSQRERVCLHVVWTLGRR